MEVLQSVTLQRAPLEAALSSHLHHTDTPTHRLGARSYTCAIPELCVQGWDLHSSTKRTLIHPT